ncbi:hypothetical protein [Methylobacterium sp. WL7]|uniref:hypothetical protein n=1 Tax=Methylobacterium sp. WL7 TaxID=2603900 RepID=UPI0011CB7D04|nr:hypothetical protein [Methylobacterium sp. WL7]TXN43562.1 hypothetical protein FV233_17855 [Methylobacterium sp. WL7]
MARPRKDVGGKLMDVRKQIVCTEDWATRVERWRGVQMPVLTWSEAVRVLVDEALDARERTKPKPD